MSCIKEIIKNGTATITDTIINEIIFNTNPIPPWSIDVPAKMLLRHVSPTPIIASPANPKVNTPINAAFLFCLYISC